MVIGFFSLAGHHKGNARLLTRSTGLTVILAIGICSIIYLTWFLPGFSVKTGFERFIPTGSAKTEVETEVEIHWDKSPRRLIVFGDSWSDNGQYPIDPPPKELMPERDEARGKAWTEWLCAAVFHRHSMCSISANTILRSLALIMTTSQGLCLNHGTAASVGPLLTVIFSIAHS